MKIVLVTGASAGIGKCCAELFEARGDKVYGAARKPDVRSDDSVNKAVAEILDREGRIDVVVNNAGIAIAGAVEDTSTEQAKDQFEVNFFGVLRVCRAVLPAMRRQRSGHIINMGSIAGQVAVPFQGLYSASKFALEGLTEALRLEVKDFGIKAALIEPGDHRTNFTANRRKIQPSPAYADRYEQAISRMEMDEQNGPDPAQIARLVGRIADDPNPRLRYMIGPVAEQAAVWLKRLGPASLVEMAMTSYYSAKPKPDRGR